jgi:hypothetical protein
VRECGSAGVREWWLCGGISFGATRGRPLRSLRLAPPPKLPGEVGGAERPGLGEGNPCCIRGAPPSPIFANCAREGNASRTFRSAIEFSPLREERTGRGRGRGTPSGASSMRFVDPPPSATPTSPSSLGEVASLSEPVGALAGAAQSRPEHDRILLSPMQFMGKRPGEGGASDAAGFRSPSPDLSATQPPPAVLGEVASLSEPVGALAGAAQSRPEHDRILPLFLLRGGRGGRPRTQFDPRSPSPDLSATQPPPAVLGEVGE